MLAAMNRCVSMDSPLDGFLDVLDVAGSWTVIHLDVVTHKSNRGKKRVQYNSPVPTSYARIRTPLGQRERPENLSVKGYDLTLCLLARFLRLSTFCHHHFSPPYPLPLLPHPHVTQAWLHHTRGWIRTGKTERLLKVGKICCGNTISRKDTSQRTLRTQAVVR